MGPVRQLAEAVKQQVSRSDEWKRWTPVPGLP